MHANRLIKKLAIPGVLAVGLAGGLALAPTSASAIPATQRACLNSGLALAGGSATYHPIGVAVHVNNGTKARRVVVFVSMDANVSVNAEMRLSWSIDGGPVTDYQFGPGNIAENQQFWGTRTVMDVIKVGPGFHTLTPEVRLSGGAGATGNVGQVCTIAEAYTK